MSELLAERNKNASEVTRVDFVIGGDHGIGAFRLCIRVIIKLISGELIHKTVQVAKVVCKKDSADILEKTILPLLTNHLKQINDSKLVIMNATNELSGEKSGEIICNMFPKTYNDYILNATIIPMVTIYVTGDIQWMCMLLGMEGMSPHWCIHCLLQKQQWSAQGHERGQERTLEWMASMVADKSKKGTAILGQKGMPYWDFIPIKNYVVSLLHCMIGIFNDIDDAFMKIIDEKVIFVTEKEEALRKEHVTMDAIIKQNGLIVESWDKTISGALRSKLIAKRNKMMKLGYDATNDAHFWTIEEDLQLVDLEEERKTLTDARDKSKSKKETIGQKLDAFKSARKRDKNSTHNKLEKISKNNGLEKDAWFGGSYNGKCSKKCMRNAQKIFDEKRMLLKQNYDQSKCNEPFIDLLCDNMIALLISWDGVFSILRKVSPTFHDTQEAAERIKLAISNHRKMNVLSVTPKVHSIEDHAFDQYALFPDGIALMIEDFVEQNHQNGHRNEENFKRIVNPDIRAMCGAKARRNQNNANIQLQIKLVNSTTARGPYKLSSSIKSDDDKSSLFSMKTEVKPLIITPPQKLKRTKIEKSPTAADDLKCNNLKAPGSLLHGEIADDSRHSAASALLSIMGDGNAGDNNSNSFDEATL